MLELLNQVVREHPLLDLINRSAALVRDRFEPTPDQQGTGDVVALNAGFATLASLNTC